MGTVVGEESLFTVYLLMLSDGWTIYTYRLIFFLIDENQTNLWWRSLATFRHIEKTARRAERFTCPQIPTASGPEPTPILRCHPSHRGLSPQSLSQYYWEVYCPQCLQHKKHFFFLLEVCKKHFDYFLILAMNILYLNEILKPIYNYYMIKIWVMIEHTCFKARTPGFKSQLFTY